MKKTILIISFLLITLASAYADSGKTVFAIQSMRIRPFDESFSGFRDACTYKTEQIVLMDKHEDEKVVKRIAAFKPALILTIGRDALDKIKSIENIPVIYVMVLNPDDTIRGKMNFCGVNMIISAESQLKTLHTALPQKKHWGVIFNPNHLNRYLTGISDVARQFGIEIVTQSVTSPKEVPNALRNIKDKIDGLWMLPDVSVIRPETLEYIFLFSDQTHHPVVAFSEIYLELGALMSIGIDAYDMGRQAGEMAQKVFNGSPINELKPVDARKAVVVINKKISEKLNIPISPEIRQNARIKE